MTTRRMLIAARAALAIVVLASLAAWLYLCGPRLTPSMYVKTPPPEPEYALEIVSALNEYYLQKGEYPPYLFGGPGKNDRSSDPRPYMLGLNQASQLSDPLIEAGILDSYPTVWKYRDKGILNTPIRNVVSSPNDPLVIFLREKYMDEALAVAKRLEAQGKADEWSSYFSGADLVSEVKQAMSHERYLCGGGVESLSIMGSGGPRGLDERGKYYVIPETLEIVDHIYSVIALTREDPEVVYQSDIYFTAADEFGYQRGEYVGGDKHGCWLWFYSDRPVLTKYLGEQEKSDIWIVGLDLVDADDGLIQPDGIPDGIVLLYKLKDGKVVEVVKDYD